VITAANPGSGGVSTLANCALEERNVTMSYVVILTSLSTAIDMMIPTGIIRADQGEDWGAR
jgi:hypothetical protein